MFFHPLINVQSATGLRYLRHQPWLVQPPAKDEMWCVSKEMWEELGVRDYGILTKRGEAQKGMDRKTLTLLKQLREGYNPLAATLVLEIPTESRVFPMATAVTFLPQQYFATEIRPLFTKIFLVISINRIIHEILPERPLL